jgi:hypothetical protein
LQPPRPLLVKGRKVIHVSLLAICRVSFCRKYLCSYCRHLKAEITTIHPFKASFIFDPEIHFY